METVNVLWTGGLDSTTMVVRFSRQEVHIKPYYFVFDYRKSTEFELSAIRAITKMICKQPDTKCIIDDVTVLEQKEIKNHPGVDDAFERLANSANELNKRDYAKWIFQKQEMGTAAFLANYYMPFQYQPLAHFSYQHGKLNIGIIEGDHRTYNTLAMLTETDHETCFVKTEDGNYILNPASPNADVQTIFKNINFPLIHGWDKPKERDYLLAHGYEDIFHATWFCWAPINDAPCGQCITCVMTINEGMEERFSPEAKERYKAIEAKLDKIKSRM